MPLNPFRFFIFYLSVPDVLHTDTLVANLAVTVTCRIGEFVTTKGLVDGTQQVSECGTNQVTGRSTSFENQFSVAEDTATVLLPNPRCFRRIHFDPLSIINLYETDYRGYACQCQAPFTCLSDNKS